MINSVITVAVYILYYLGDVISRPMVRFDLGWLYPIYNKLMIASADLQERHHTRGPWRAG